MKSFESLFDSLDAAEDLEEPKNKIPSHELPEGAVIKVWLSGSSHVRADSYNQFIFIGEIFVNECNFWIVQPDTSEENPPIYLLNPDHIQLLEIVTE